MLCSGGSRFVTTNAITYKDNFHEENELNFKSSQLLRGTLDFLKFNTYTEILMKYNVMPPNKFSYFSCLGRYSIQI